MARSLGLLKLRLRGPLTILKTIFCLPTCRHTTKIFVPERISSLFFGPLTFRCRSPDTFAVLLSPLRRVRVFHSSVPRHRGRVRCLRSDSGGFQETRNRPWEGSSVSHR